MVILRYELSATVTNVGRLFDKDHTTVMHHSSKHKYRLQQDTAYRELYFYLRESIADLLFEDNTPAKPIIENIKKLCDLSFTERTESGM